MQRNLDFSTTWSDAVAMLRQHREAVVAIAGLLMLMPNWASGFFVGQPDVEGLTSFSDIFAAQSEHFSQYWMILLPLALLSLFGSVSVLVLFLRQDIGKVGDALLLASKLLPVYFLVSILTGLFTAFGALALFVGLFYIAGRLMPVGPVVVAERDKGILGSIGRGWELTRGLGWKCFLLFLIVMLVAYITMAVVNLAVGMICILIAGPEGVPIIQTLVGALTEAIFSIIILALQAALYRHLQRQDIPSVA